MIARVAVAVILLAGVAHAQVTATKAAEDTFNKGRELVKQKRFAEACEAFKQSQQLDPQYGTQYNLAGCFVAQGKLASAWNLYRELSRSDTNPDRKQASAEQAAALAPRVPKIAIVFEHPPDGAKLQMNDVDAIALVGIETPVDLGSYVFTATAPGYQLYRQSVDVSQEHATVRVVVALVALVASRHEIAPEAPMVDDGGSAKPTYGKIAAVTGGVVVGVGLGFGGLASRRWSDAKTLAATDVSAANRTAHAARIDGDISTGLVIGGVAIAAVGVYLWLFTHDESAHVAFVPLAAPDAGGVVMTGHF